MTCDIVAMCKRDLHMLHEQLHIAEERIRHTSRFFFLIATTRQIEFLVCPLLRFLVAELRFHVTQILSLVC